MSNTLLLAYLFILYLLGFVFVYVAYKKKRKKRAIHQVSVPTLQRVFSPNPQKSKLPAFVFSKENPNWVLSTFENNLPCSEMVLDQVFLGIINLEIQEAKNGKCRYPNKKDILQKIYVVVVHNSKFSPKFKKAFQKVCNNYLKN